MKSKYPLSQKPSSHYIFIVITVPGYTTGKGVTRWRLSLHYCWHVAIPNKMEAETSETSDITAETKLDCKTLV